MCFTLDRVDPLVVDEEAGGEGGLAFEASLCAAEVMGECWGSHDDTGKEGEGVMIVALYSSPKSSSTP